MATTTIVSPASQGIATAQLTFGQMWRELLLWNPDLDPFVAKRFIQNCYRRMIDHRMWYGLMCKGLISVPQAYSTGTVSVVNGSQTITGSGTNWVSSMVGQQIRMGYMQPTYTITAVVNTTTLTIDIPWGDPSVSTSGYMIFSAIVSLGPTTKELLVMVNQRMGYRVLTHIPQQNLDEYDSWRAATGWTWIAASYPPSAAGVPQVELYPIPTFAQSFPFMAYVQPPDIGTVNGDADTPLPFFRSDVIVSGAMADAKMFRRDSPYYDPVVAKMKMAEYNSEMAKLESVDNGHVMKDYLYNARAFPLSSFGSAFMQQHDYEGGDY